jgi:MFS family permease
MAIGVLMASTGFLLAGHCHSHHAMVTAFVLVGIGYCASFYVSSTVVVTNWMESQRSFGMGIVFCATSVGAAAFSLLIGRWLEMYGWRVTIELIAVLVALMFPLILLTIRTSPAHPVPGGDDASENFNTRREGRTQLSSPTFIITTASSALFAIGMGGVYYHVVSLLVKAGYSVHLAGLAFGASWLLTAIGSLALGAIADRVGVQRVLTSALFCCASGTLLLLGVRQTWIGVACVVAFVVLWGTPATSAYQFVPVIFAERFGSKNLGRLIGVQSAIMGIAGAAAPIGTGILYDKFNDYRIAVYLSAAALFVACVLALLINMTKCAGGTSNGGDVG